jgi:putative membrane protein
MNKYFPHALLILYVIEFVVCGINPYSRAVWWAENVPIVGVVLGLLVLYIKNIRFSNFTYLMISILPFWHTIGGHYTFERVPFGWFNQFFGFERNMFDRIGHFSVGFYALALAEYLLRWNKVASKFWAFFTAFCFIGTVAMMYELIEWQYAVQAGGDAGIAFLGSQGDIWDAQKDMLMDMLGAGFALLIGVFTLKNVRH